MNEKTNERFPGRSLGYISAGPCRGLSKRNFVEIYERVLCELIKRNSFPTNFMKQLRKAYMEASSWINLCLSSLILENFEGISKKKTWKKDFLDYFPNESQESFVKNP